MERIAVLVRPQGIRFFGGGAEAGAPRYIT